jgi:hypothetical protein
LSEGEREREGGGEGDVGDGNKARWGREMKARAAHPDERGYGARPRRASARRCLVARLLSAAEPRKKVKHVQ